jgi:hypothetical protein
MFSARLQRVVGSVLIAYAVYRAVAAAVNLNPLGLLPAACAAVLGLWLLRRARRRLAPASEPARGGPGAPPS